jgi:hypothetical protein
MFSRMTTGPMKQESLNAYKDMKVILDKVKSNKPLTGLEKARVQGIDRRLMPIVFENTSFEQGTKDDASKAVNPMN